MLARRPLLAGVAAGTLLAAVQIAEAAEGPKVVASFSILGDIVREVGGERVEVTTLVDPDGDAHVFEPSPTDARAVAGADLVIVNGLGFEGWMERLVEAAGYDGTVAVASAGVKPLEMGDDEHADEDEHAHDEEHAEEAHAEEDHHEHGSRDPHAWQSLANGRLYVANVATALSAADPEGADGYRQRADAYAARLAEIDARMRAAVAALPPERRRLVTSHEAFGYLGAEYGLEFIAPQGASTESEASAADVAALIRQIRADRIPAVFVENVSDPRLTLQITRETDAVVGGILYSDALSGPDGPAPTYLRMFEHNLATLTEALGS